MKIRPRRYRSGNTGWEADCGLVNGERVQKCFPTKKEAEDFVAEMKGKMRAHGHAAFALTEEERIQFAGARDRLAAAGATITQATDFYLAKHRTLKKAMTLRELLDACVLDKELAGASDRYITQFASSCRSFLAGRESMVASEVTRDVVKLWILGKGLAPKTQRTYLGDVRTLLAWAKQERYIAENPIAGEDGFIKLADESDREIEALTVEDCGKLLWTALFGVAIEKTRAGTGRWVQHEVVGGFRVLIGYIAVAMFTGVRPDEIKRTTIAEMDLQEKALIIAGKSAKTRQRRVIELPRIAIVWLRLWRRLCPNETKLTPKNFDRKWKALRKAAKLAGWPHDALRHTCATFHYAAFQNLAALQALLGHSEDEDTLFRHYRAVRTITGKMISKKMAEEFWRLTPRRIRLNYAA